MDGILGYYTDRKSIFCECVDYDGKNSTSTTKMQVKGRKNFRQQGDPGYQLASSPESILVSPSLSNANWAAIWLASFLL